MQRYKCGQWVIEPERNTLTGPSGETPLAPRAMEVLQHLVQSRDRVVTIDELMDKFWTNRHVESSTIHRCVNRIRKAFLESATNSHFISTFPKRGYQFVGVIDELPTQTLNQLPSTAEDHLIAGQLLCRTPTRTRMHEAAEHFASSAGLDPKLGAARVGQIIVQLHLADMGEPWWDCHDKALEESKRLLSSQCSESDQVLGEALLNHMEERDRAAQVLFERLLSIDPRHEIGLFYAAKTRMILGDYRGVVVTCKRLLEVDPLSPASDS